MGSKEKEKQVTVSVTLEIVLTQEDIDDIMCGALEGGITYWCDEAKVVGDYLGEYGSEQIARGGKLRLHLPEPFDKDETEYYELDLEKFKKGVELWAITPVGCNCLEQMDTAWNGRTGRIGRGGGDYESCSCLQVSLRQFR